MTAIIVIHLVEVLIELVAWVLSGFIIAFCGTYGSKVILHKRKFILLGIGLGILSMYTWWFFFDFELDYRVLLLLSFIIFAVGLAVSVAFVLPHSERYFLKVQGAVKEMDVALYKWFRNDPDRVVTIGRSVDCSLQLSWDLMGDIAPMQAEIRRKHNHLYLTAIEDGVTFEGKPLAADEWEWLHQGDTFTIGNTTFTYIEKDMVKY